RKGNTRRLESCTWRRRRGLAAGPERFLLVEAYSKRYRWPLRIPQTNPDIGLGKDHASEMSPTEQATDRHRAPADPQSSRYWRSVSEVSKKNFSACRFH